jgi:lysosomal alpha-mannosidase
MNLFSSSFDLQIRTCTKTETVQSALIIFNDWTSQEISLFQGAPTVEIEWTVGPIPISDKIGKEIIIRYDTDIESASKYYTDANGREVLERIRDYRPTWNYSVTEPVSGNYYPINSRIWIKDGQRQLTILTGNDYTTRSCFYATPMKFSTYSFITCCLI